MVDARRERSQLEVRAEKLTADLAVLAATDQIEIGIGQVESQHEELGRLASSIGHLTQDVRTLAQAIALLDLHQSEASAFGSLTLPPMLTNSQPLEEIIEALGHTKSDVECQSARADSLSALPICPDITDDRSLTELIRDLNSAQLVSRRLGGECVATRELLPPPFMIEVETLRMTAANIGTLSREFTVSEQKLTALGRLATAPELDNEVSLVQDVQALTRATAELRRTEAVHGRLDALFAAPDLADTREIEAEIRDLTSANAAVASRTQELEQAEELLREGERLLRTWAEQQQLCPTCGSPLDPNQIVVHAGSCVGGHPHD
jgi:DNA repair exonuclease SbcCD ATPase subunit